jgi:hypothetical protein
MELTQRFDCPRCPSFETRLGHSQIATTIDTYSDVLPELDEMAADLLDAEPEERDAIDSESSTDAALL